MKKRVKMEKLVCGETNGFHTIINGRIESYFTAEDMEIYRFMIGGMLSK
ncbi:hypothetical protein Metho_0983 [Methanomethylovorans hollandica DSM 15978]|jgi:hypothetical protein|uniref:Uncharacterized protein n=1 Tax=Methanomethylovorans hollandica (strain DSM 15978 / NBRC 107637 / DMS1) TaxID=867904 RepID=L0KUU7_METHD|nr:hypothetical protein [Methanomethylovorans hollandica]AGB49222.1 hypothetical protein Metho_0983 [Methanomethylovorans hollandica DSM 15978]